MDSRGLQTTVQRRVGSIDGCRFFSESPLCSGYFLVVTGTGFIGVLYDFYLWLSYGHGSSSPTLLAFLMFATGFVYSWWAVIQNFRRVRAVNSATDLASVEEGSSLSAALDAAAWGPMQALFYCYVAMLVMEVIMGSLLKRLS